MISKRECKRLRRGDFVMMKVREYSSFGGHREFARWRQVYEPFDAEHFLYVEQGAEGAEQQEMRPTRTRVEIGKRSQTIRLPQSIADWDDAKPPAVAEVAPGEIEIVRCCGECGQRLP